jgi:hypothetical protein
MERTFVEQSSGLRHVEIAHGCALLESTINVGAGYLGIMFENFQGGAQLAGLKALREIPIVSEGSWEPRSKWLGGSAKSLR